MYSETFEALRTAYLYGCFSEDLCYRSIKAPVRQLARVTELAVTQTILIGSLRDVPSSTWTILCLNVECCRQELMSPACFDTQPFPFSLHHSKCSQKLQREVENVFVR